MPKMPTSIGVLISPAACKQPTITILTARPNSRKISISNTLCANDRISGSVVNMDSTISLVI